MTQLFPDTVRHLRRLKVELEDMTLSMDESYQLRVIIELGDESTYVLCHERVPFGEIGDLPRKIQDLYDAFLWGAGLTSVLNQADVIATGDKQKRVRRALRSFN